VTDPRQRAEALLMEAASTVSMPAQSSERMARVLLEHAQFRVALAETLEFHAGYAGRTRQLVSLVNSLLRAVSANSNGLANWMTELPNRGTAPAVRRAFNALIRFMRRPHEQPSNTEH
jgi:hypothetical protein